MEKREQSKSSQHQNGGSKHTFQKTKAKLLKTYYGNPMKDMKLITITGTTGTTTVAHFVHEILRSSGEQVAVLASEKPFKVSILHKFLSDAWKAGANYVIVTTPVQSLKNNVFYDLPIHIAAMTNFVTSSLTDMTPEEYLQNEKTTFNMKPENIVLNADDLNFVTFGDCRGTKNTISYGQSSTDVKILNSKLYKKGVEASFSVNSEVIPVASFLTGETIIPYMACATAIACLLNIHSTHIIDGIANYNPDNV